MVKKTIPQSLGFLSCLYGSEKTACHLLLHEDIKKEDTLNCLLQGFQCSKCDKFFKSKDEKYFRIIETPEMEMDHHLDHIHVKGGFATLLSKAAYIQNELFNNLSGRLTSRPNVVREFAEAVLGVETEELVRKMVPVVLPKLLVYWQENAQAANTLNELAKLLDTDVVPLIVNWLPRVLAFALNQEEDKNLLSVLQLYHSQIGSDNQEIFAAALPALLDELVCFVDIADTPEIDRRYELL